MARAVKRSRWRRLSLIAAAATTIAACPALAADEPVGHQPVIVEVSINGLAAGRDIYALRDAEGRIYVRLADLKAWRIKAAPPSAPLIFESQHYAPLHDIPGLTYAFTEQSQLLQVQASADIFEMSTLGARRRNLGPMTRPRAGAFLNYDLYGQTGVEGDSLGGLLELGAFAGGASGTTTLLGRSYDGGSELVRLESTWTIDNPETMRFLRFGDSIARGSASTPPFRFGGVQWGTNFAIRPGFLMMPTPTMQGSAALPSTVDIYVNDVLTARERAPAGPFEITTPPILSGDGVVRMVIEDVLGRQTEQTLQYYSGPGLLAAGLHDYSYEAGFLRQDFGARSFSYKDAFVAGTHRYGVSNSLTAELHGEISSRAQLIGGSATTLLPFGGVATLSAAASRRERRRGYQLGLAFERRHGAIRFSGAADYASGDFGGVWSADVTGEETFLGRLAVSTRLGEARLTGSYLHRSRGGEQDDFLQLATSFEAPFLGWVTVSAQEGLGDSDETDVHVFLSRSLGGRTNFSASLDPGSDSRVAGAAIQRNLPTGEGLGYRAAVAVGEAPGAQGRLLYQSATQTYTAEASQTEAGTQLRAGVSGAVALVGGEVVASRKLNDSFAVVKVGEFEGVRVYSDNRLVGRTNKSGIAVVPSLRSYDRNLISIEQGDLPIEAELGELEQEVRPYARNGVLVDFKAEVTGGAFITVELEDGKPLPAGAKARVNGLPTNFVSAPGGEIFLTGLDIENRVQIQWAQGSCELRVIKFRTGEAQPRLGRQVCKVEKANVG